MPKQLAAILASVLGVLAGFALSNMLQAAGPHFDEWSQDVGRDQGLMTTSMVIMLVALIGAIAIIMTNQLYCYMYVVTPVSAVIAGYLLTDAITAPVDSQIGTPMWDFMLALLFAAATVGILAVQENKASWL